MVQTDFLLTREDGVNLYRSYSTNNMMIRQIETGDLYEEAVDVEGLYTYEETDIPIVEEEYLEPQDALNMIFGEGVVHGPVEADGSSQVSQDD